ncbi:TRAP transporter substrate-binding protein [Alicycliphilus sp. T452]|jgi:TRAP-type C4-dicarboxylate transport system substrate-binding protein
MPRFHSPAVRTARRWLLALPLAAAVAAPLGAHAQQELKYASAAPPGSIFARQIERLAADIAAETGGAVKIVPFHNSQLGAEADVISQIARGRLDMGGFASTTLALQVPEVAMLQMPFFFDSEAQRDCVMDGHVKPLLEAALEKKGLKFVTWGESGSGQLIGKKAYAGPEDVRGIKMGIFASKSWSEFWRRFGANPVPVSSPDMASSLQTGLIDALSTSPVFYVTSGLNKIAPVLTKVDIAGMLTINVINKKLFDGFPPAVQAQFMKGTFKVPTATVRKEIREFNEVVLAAHTKGGGTVASVAPEQRAAWQKGLEGYYGQIAKDYGPAGERLYAAMSAGKKACKAQN